MKSALYAVLLILTFLCPWQKIASNRRQYALLRQKNEPTMLAGQRSHYLIAYRRNLRFCRRRHTIVTVIVCLHCFSIASYDSNGIFTSDLASNIKQAELLSDATSIFSLSLIPSSARNYDVQNAPITCSIYIVYYGSQLTNKL